DERSSTPWLGNSTWSGQTGCGIVYGLLGVGNDHQGDVNAHSNSTSYPTTIACRFSCKYKLGRPVST
ncbi:uncharacterized protein MYCGRDRAFT_103995, partial [Zymoseptoria tritici IPO323]